MALPKSSRSTTKVAVTKASLKAKAKAKAKPTGRSKNGGARVGAGKPKGSVSKLTAARKKTGKAARQALTDFIIKNDSGLTPLEFMLKVMRNPANSWAARQTAARDAAQYVHPRLTAVTHKGNPAEPVTFAEMPADVFADLARKVINEI